MSRIHTSFPDVLMRRRCCEGKGTQIRKALKTKEPRESAQPVQSGGLLGGWPACEVAMTVWLLESGDESNAIERVLG